MDSKKLLDNLKAALHDLSAYYETINRNPETRAKNNQVLKALEQVTQDQRELNRLGGVNEVIKFARTAACMGSLFAPQNLPDNYENPNQLKIT